MRDVTRYEQEQPEIAHFAWQVPESGFEVRIIQRPRASKAGDFLLQAIFPRVALGVEDRLPSEALTPRDPDQGARLYRPLDEHDLFLKFSNLDPSKESILGFANRYGSLGTQEAFIDNGKLIQCDSLEAWRESIQELHKAVDLHEAKKPRLGQLIRWDSDGEAVRYVGPDGKTEKISDPYNYQPHLFQSLKGANLADVARLYLAVVINRNLRGLVSPGLISVGSVTGKLQGTSRPHNLLGALWYQLYLQVVSGRPMRRCLRCDEPMVYSRSTKTMHSWCSNIERQQRKRLRDRRKNAEKKTRKR